MRLFKYLFSKYFPFIHNWIRRLRYEKYVLPPKFMSHVSRLSPGSLVIDVGANIGLVTETLARRGLRVISFEPNSYAFDKLKTLTLKFNNIELRKEAAGIKNQKIKLFLHKDFINTKADLTQASSLLDSKPNISSFNFELVNEIDFAEFLKSLNESVALIKIDIEGYEIQLLNHLLDVNVVNKVGAFYVETHERKFPDLIESTNNLKKRINAEGFNDKFFFNWH